MSDVNDRDDRDDRDGRDGLGDLDSCKDLGSRNDLRAALARGSDAAEDLVMLEQALTAIADEEAPIAPEDRQRTLLAAVRLLHKRAALLTSTFDALWNLAK